MGRGMLLGPCPLRRAACKEQRDQLHPPAATKHSNKPGAALASLEGLNSFGKESCRNAGASWSVSLHSHF